MRYLRKRTDVIFFFSFFFYQFSLSKTHVLKILLSLMLLIEDRTTIHQYKLCSSSTRGSRRSYSACYRRCRHLFQSAGHICPSDTGTTWYLMLERNQGSPGRTCSSNVPCWLTGPNSAPSDWKILLCPAPPRPAPLPPPSSLSQVCPRRRHQAGDTTFET